MMSYEDWLQELIPITKDYAVPRIEYYQRWLPNSNPKDIYAQLTECATFNKPNPTEVSE